LNKQALEELKSPMYATSVGLLIKGVQAVEDAEAGEHEEVASKKSGKVKDIAEEKNKKESWFSKLLSDFIKDDTGIDDDTFIGRKQSSFPHRVFFPQIHKCGKRL